MEIIITDLTRFKNQNIVCTAGVTDDGTVIRPMPYLKVDICRKLDIHPGGILQGDFSFEGTEQPHIEDATYDNLYFKGPCSSDVFREALDATLFDSMSDGFEFAIPKNQKCIPISESPPRSLITIKVRPKSFLIEQNSFDPNKLKAHLSDAQGTSLSYVGITDRGFYDHAQSHSKESGSVQKLNQFIQSQEELYLRIGLSRPHKAQDGRSGYWIQVNGIYTFPNFLHYIRCYE